MSVAIFSPSLNLPVPPPPQSPRELRRSLQKVRKRVSFHSMGPFSERREVVYFQEWLLACKENRAKREQYFRPALPHAGARGALQGSPLSRSQTQFTQANHCLHRTRTQWSQPPGLGELSLIFLLCSAEREWPQEGGACLGVLQFRPF